MSSRSAELHALAVSRQRALDLRRNQHRTRTPRWNARDDTPSVDFPFTVNSSDPEMFRLVIVSRGRVKFELELSWTCVGRTGHTVIRDLGRRPFIHP
jgi:hypothetical protein